jgi:DNA-directed RNA polymerase specialized sigma subunit
LYEWLRDYQNLENEIIYLEFNLEQTERELKRWVEGDLSEVKLTQDSLGSKVEEAIEKIKEDLQFKQQQKENLIKLVDRFKGLDHKILRLKYVDGMTLDNIAHELGYSTSHIYKKHAEIVRMIKFADELSLDCR